MSSEINPANLSRELSHMEQHGLFTSTQQGGQKYFHLDKKYLLYEELRRIVSKTVGAVVQLRDQLEESPGIQEALLYGSFARNQQDASSDIDVLIIGRPNARQLERAVRQLESRLGREINYTVPGPEEFRARKARKDAFLDDIYRHRIKRCFVRIEGSRSQSHRVNSKEERIALMVREPSGHGP